MIYEADPEGNVSLQGPGTFSSLIFRHPEFSWQAYVAVTCVCNKYD